ncbi:MAG: class D sortase [Terracidiphilus sp.]|jgi:sortase A
MIGTTELEAFDKRGQRFIRWTQRIFMITGILALSYVGLTLFSARLFQAGAELTLEKQIHAEEQHKTAFSHLLIKEGDVLGRIEIPRIGVSVVVLQGTTSQTLRLGVGHIEGTALPGEDGNIGIAGHRDTYFRGLKDIRKDDEILLQTAAGVTKYDVDWIQITAPADGGIVSLTTKSALTLVTCYPFHYIGAAPERFVVYAHRK